MSHRSMYSSRKDRNGVYVGNLPNAIEEDEVRELFEPYENVAVLRVIKKDIKAFAFLHCETQEDVVQVVYEMDKMEVMGRNIIVRALDDDLQDSIEAELENEYNNESRNMRGNKFRNNSSRYSDSWDEGAESSWSRTSRDGRSRQSSGRIYSPPSSVSSNQRHIGNWQEQTDPLSEDEANAIAVLRVSNFPYGTVKSDLLKLFEEFEPLDVHIISNEFRQGRMTEALVTVPSEEFALEAIMNLDNTLYRRRTLLVTDGIEEGMTRELVSLEGILSNK